MLVSFVHLIRYCTTPTLSTVDKGCTRCRQEVQAAEEAVQAQAHKLTAVLQEKGSLEAQLQQSRQEVAAVQAAAAAAGQRKDAHLHLLEAQLKVLYMLAQGLSQCVILASRWALHMHKS